MDHEPRFRQQRWLLAGAALACVIALLAVVALRPAESNPDGLRFLGSFHPLFVHLPIGVLVLAVLAEIASSKADVRARLDPVITPVLVVLVGTALAALIAGLSLARGGGYPDALLGPHRWLAVAGMTLLCGSLAAWSLQRPPSSAHWRTGYRALLGTSALTLGASAHFGGSMTHGEAYLVRYAPQPFAGWIGVEPATKTVQPSPPADEARVYADVVQPVLAKYCVNCHGPEKAKGKLRLDSYAGLMQGGEAGPAIVARAPEKSHLVTMLRLPQDDVEHMPPKGKPQPSQAQVELIGWWVLRGAHEHERVREVLPPGAVFELLKAAERAGRPKAP